MRRGTAGRAGRDLGVVSVLADGEVDNAQRGATGWASNRRRRRGGGLGVKQIRSRVGECRAVIWKEQGGPTHPRLAFI